MRHPLLSEYGSYKTVRSVRSDYGLDFQAKVLKTFSVVPVRSAADCARMGDAAAVRFAGKWLQAFLTPSVHQVVLQNLISTEIRQCILYYCQRKEQVDGFVGVNFCKTTLEPCERKSAAASRYTRTQAGAYPSSGA